MESKEVWKPVVGYEGIYEISSIGRVKSLKFDKEKILKRRVSASGYLTVGLYKDNKNTTTNIHKLVAESFLNHKPNGHKLVVDHINDVRTDNRLDNLQIVSHRFNTCKTQGKYSSKYKGVYWNKNAKKWLASIHIKGKRIHLGLFDNEIDASKAYQEKLKQITKC